MSSFLCQGNTGWLNELVAKIVSEEELRTFLGLWTLLCIDGELELMASLVCVLEKLGDCLGGVILWSDFICFLSNVLVVAWNPQIVHVKGCTPGWVFYNYKHLGYQLYMLCHTCLQYLTATRKPRVLMKIRERWIYSSHCCTLHCWWTNV